jgi:hypothetical protein
MRIILAYTSYTIVRKDLKGYLRKLNLLFSSAETIWVDVDFFE